MPAHHFFDRYRIGRGAGCGVDDGSHFPEVVWSENAGRHNREHLRVGGVKVVEAVDGSATYAKYFTRPDRATTSVHGPGQYARKPVDGLFISVMTVRDGHPRSGRHVKFEGRDRTTGCLALDQESNRQRPNTDLFACPACHLFPSHQVMITRHFLGKAGAGDGPRNPRMVGRSAHTNPIRELRRLSPKSGHE